MRTKTLLLAAATTLAAGLISAQADTVYSQNIVGYVNQVFPGGNAFTLCVAPLKGTNTANNAEELLKCLQTGDTVYLWTGGGYDINTYIDVGLWVNGNGDITNTPTLAPGQGFFYQNGQPSDETNTYVGVVQLTNSTVLPGGNSLSLVGSTAPIGGNSESTNFAMPLQTGDTIYTWTGGGYDISTYIDVALWVNGNGDITNAPNLKVGDGFFYQNGQGSDSTWNQSVTVQ